MNTQTAITPLSGQPKKLFYRIKDVAKMTGVKPYVLRYWESEFPDLSPEKDASDQRRYRAKDIQTVMAIRKLLYEDRFTIQGARKQLKHQIRALAGTPMENTTTLPSAEIVEVKSAEPPVETAPPEVGEIAKPFKTVNLYARALSENLSLIRKEVNDLLAELNG
ncbi:MerR family transcriptional regulator [Candidatus Sumerlaeota bacterium]|nr:MerR family transcriptional regulator [Candidatus Sumerlaeota bacterium]